MTKEPLCRAKVVGGALAWSGFKGVLSGSANDRVWRTESKRGNRFEYLCYRGCRKRLALELEGQSDAQAVQEERVRVMDGSNPRVILRNYIAQNAIEAAENGDFSEVSIDFVVSFWISFLLSFIFPSLHCHSLTLVIFASTRHCRSDGSSKFWRSHTVHSRAWSFRHGWAAAARLQIREREMKAKSNSKRRHLRLHPEIRFLTTASPRPGPARYASHDHRNYFPNRCCPE